MRKAKAIIGIAATALVLAAGAASGQFNDGIDRADPNFVKPYLLVFDPGNALFACVGHAAIRLKCSKFDLDYCFSYESENATSRLLSFFAGKLKMGMFAVPTEDFLKPYEEEGRGVVQYAMNLPPATKQRLWEILDKKAAEGADLPYDYNRRGCAKSAGELIMQSLAQDRVERAPWIPDSVPSRREKFCELLAEDFPWNLFILNAIVGTEVDNIEEVVVPKDLLAFLQKTRVEGRPIVSGEGERLLASTMSRKSPLITPMIMAVLMVVLAVANCLFIRRQYVDWLFLLVQTVFGCFVLYLMTATKLPTSCWNWLIVPFNPLPVIFWRWRRYWALPFALVVVAWLVFMLCYPHRLTDPAYLVIALAYVAIWVKAAMVRWGRITRLEYLLKGKCVTF